MQQHITAFMLLVRQHDRLALDCWLLEAEQTGLPDLLGFALIACCCEYLSVGESGRRPRGILGSARRNYISRRTIIDGDTSYMWTEGAEDVRTMELTPYIEPK